MVGETSTSVLHRHAENLRGAYSALTPIPPIREALPDAGLSEAYAIQDINTRHWLSEGRRIVGAKIGLTSRSVQRQLGVDQPDFGILFDDMAVNDGESISPRRMIQPKVEGEIAFVLRRTPDPLRLTSAELINCIDYALPAIEIVDSRIADWNIGMVDTIADNASSGLFVIGTRPVALADIDLRLCGMVLEKNGEPVSFGAGAACLGNPLHALGWLAAQMSSVGRPLASGDIILAGALGPMVSVNPGDYAELRISGLGSVRVSFAEAA